MFFCFPAENTRHHAAGLAGQGMALHPYSRDSLLAALPASARCVVVWQSPRKALAQALQTHERPSAALGRWLEGAQEILALYRGNRRKMLLVEDAVLSRPDLQDERDRLAQRLNLTAIPDGGAHDPIAPVIDLIATLAPAMIEPLQSTLSELVASSYSAPPPALVPLTDMDSAAQELTGLTLENRHLKQAEATIRAEAARTARALHDAQAERALLITQIGLSDDAIRNLGSALDEARAQAADLDQRLAETRQETEELRTRMLRAQAEMEALSATARQTRQDADARRAEAEQLRQRLTQSQMAVEQLVAAEKAALARIAELEAANAQARREADLALQAVQGKLSESQNRLRAEQTAAQTLRNQETSLKADVAALQQRIAQTEADRAGICAENDLFRAQLLLMQTEMGHANSELETYKAEQDRLNRALNTSEQAVTRALATARSEAEARQAAEQDLLALRQHLATEQGVVQDLQNQLRSAQQDLRQHEDTTRQQILGLQAERDALQKEVQRILDSASIRLTEPLRAARRLMSRLTGPRM